MVGSLSWPAGTVPNLSLYLISNDFGDDVQRLKQDTDISLGDKKVELVTEVAARKEGWTWWRTLRITLCLRRPSISGKPSPSSAPGDQCEIFFTSRLAVGKLGFFLFYSSTAWVEETGYFLFFLYIFLGMGGKAVTVAVRGPSFSLPPPFSV